MNEYPRVLSATTMIGDMVVNPQGEDLGTLKEIILDALLEPFRQLGSL